MSQPTIRRLQTSSTTARCRNPVAVGMWVDVGDPGAMRGVDREVRVDEIRRRLRLGSRTVVVNCRGRLTPRDAGAVHEAQPAATDAMTGRHELFARVIGVPSAGP